MSRVLLVTWEGGGVVPPELGLARRLIARGHAVHVLADASVAAEAAAAGCTFSPFRHAPSRASLRPEHEVFRGWEAGNPLAEFQGFLQHVMCGPAERYAADVLDALDAAPADAALVDMNLLGAIAAAQARGLPTGVLVPNIYLRPAPGIPPVGPGFLPAAGPLDRARDAALTWLSRWLWRGGLAPVNAACARVGAPPVGDIFELYDRADAVYVLTAAAFDFPATVLPPNVRYVGPLLDDPAWAGAGGALPWPHDDPRPLIVVSLSSTFQGQIATTQRVIDALGGLDARVLVTLGPALELADVRSSSSNVVCVRGVPHGQVLPRASVVVTHSGHGTTIKALSFGVPLVCVPMGRDQMDTAARVVARGAGVRVNATAAPATIRAAVQRVLADPSFASSAAALGASIRASAQVDPSTYVEQDLRLRADPRAHVIHGRCG
jgi:UDP:flavonoid glycosyltransferase YjiC (YdhE family)